MEALKQALRGNPKEKGAIEHVPEPPSSRPSSGGNGAVGARGFPGTTQEDKEHASPKRKQAEDQMESLKHKAQHGTEEEKAALKLLGLL